MTNPLAPQPESSPDVSETFGNIPHASEAFGKMRNDAEAFRTVRNLSARNENHTLTVREVARLFEAAGVARTERSIVNWCQPNRTRIARLDAYFDPNERRYYITTQSVELAIAEEQAKAAKANQPPESFGSVPKASEGLRVGPEELGRATAIDSTDAREAGSRVKTLEQEVTDLKITNRATDYFIDQLKQDREAFAVERQSFVEKLIVFTRKVGELETQLRQLTGPWQPDAQALSAADNPLDPADASSTAPTP